MMANTLRYGFGSEKTDEVQLGGSSSMGQVGQEFSNNIAMLAIWLMKRFKLVWEDLFRI
jgi:hypothetical protein